ncbi:MAG: copper chaperone PCu(A)C [Oligoflexia bacterium]|nr:copper chaperone PCu(A)C [Oligoflexia bacterium]
MKNWIMIVSLFLIPASAWCQASNASKIQAEGAYVAAVPATDDNTAAYFTLKNPTDQAISLVGGNSSVAKKVEIHNHIHKDGQMKMVHLESLEIPAHGEVKLAPMGLHVMLIGLKDSFRKAKSVELTLKFSDKTQLKIKAPIKAEE